MSIRTWLLFLIGNEDAILRLASDRRTLGVGLLFVLSAGFAREYDGQDLLHEPWHLLIPLGASLVSSFLLFSLLYLKLIWSDHKRPSFFSGYLSFLGLFWMTAPLAWLYAVPYERFFPETTALTANLITLGVVAVWRVYLMICVASSLMGHRGWAAFGLVMAYGDVVALLAIALLPVNVVHTMSGARGATPKDDILFGVQQTVGCSGVCLLPVWILIALVTVVRSSPVWNRSGNPSPPSYPPTWGLWGLAIASVLVWAAILPFTQPEQQLRHRVERHISDGQIAEALAVMSAHSPADFPPHWRPPPHVKSGEDQHQILDVIEMMLDHPPAPWVRDLYLSKFETYLMHYRFDEGFYDSGSRFAEELKPRTVRLILRLPERFEIVRKEPWLFKRMVESDDLTRQERDELQRLLNPDGGR